MCTSNTKLTLRVLGGEVEDKGDRVASVRGYLEKIKISLTADELYKEEVTKKRGGLSTATISIIGQNIAEMEGYRHANGKMDKGEYWKYDTLIGLSKMSRTRIEVENMNRVTGGTWMVNNDKTFKQLARRILKWCVARVIQVELDWAWEEANTKKDGRLDDP